MQVGLNQVGSTQEVVSSIESLPVPEAKLNDIATNLLSATPTKTPEPRVLKGNNSIDNSSESDNEPSVEESNAIDWEELLADEVIDPKKPLDLTGTFTVVSYPFCYKGSSLVSETVKFCGISTTCPWLKEDEDKKIVNAHLSSIMDGFDGKPIVIDLGNRIYTLTMTQLRITKQNILDFLKEEQPEIRELYDPEWFKLKVFIPSSIKV